MKIVVIGAWAPALLSFRGPLLEALVSRGHTVTAMAPDGTLEVVARLAALGVEFQALPVERAGTNALRDLTSIVSLRARLRSLQPDLVFSYAIKPVIYGSIAAWLARVPRRTAMITGLGYAFSQPRTLKHRLIAAIAMRLYREALRHCDVVFFQNGDDRDVFQRLGLLSTRAQVSLVRGSGVDLQHYALQPLPEGAPRFLFVGRLLRDKGIFDYVEAARRVRARNPAAWFGVMGWIDPNPESATQTDVARWAAEGVIEYLGASADVRPELTKAHVLVLPSYREGTPRSVLEAMSMGRAVITTDVPGCRDVVENEQSGLLVPVRDPARLAEATLRLTADRALLLRLASAGRRRVETYYDASAIAAQMVETLRL